MHIDLSNKRVIVTGASRGIGRAIANAFAREGARVAVCARTAGDIKTVGEELALTAQGVIARAVDVTDSKGVKTFVDEVADSWGGVDVLINNAGFGTFGEFKNADATKISEQIQVNVLALVELTKLALPSMIKRNEGVILNVASTAAYQSVPYMAVYAATKAFVLSFTEALWGELIGTKVTAIALSPGGTKTEFFEVASNGKSPDGLGKLMTVEQVITVAMNALDKPTPPPSVISGAANFVLATSGRLVPRQLLVKIARSMFKSRN